MTSANSPFFDAFRRPAGWGFSSLLAVGVVSFLAAAGGRHPHLAWQAYLINFLLWSGIAQGGLLFSALMHVVKARWSGRMAGIAESMAAFFPISFVLFLFLFVGRDHVFPWLHYDLHGKEAWLNVPFLLARDGLGLLILYGVGFVFLYHSLNLRVGMLAPVGKLRTTLHRRWSRAEMDPDAIRSRMTLWAMLYCLSFALVLSLIGYDLVMALDPHWISTLFGAYCFVKPIYIGLGGLIVLASVLYIRYGADTGLTADHFHDVGKLFFGFALVWADFFYAQFVVIWYGNIPEETSYVIARTMTAPWRGLAWTVLLVSFVGPFLILLNKKIKTLPRAMTVLCTAVIAGIWLEHLLLIGPALNHGATRLPLGILDLLITLGFLGMMALAVRFFLNLFPEVVHMPTRDMSP